ncbi:carbon-nitrogen family hydrolase [Anaerobacillus isosaccharinicus]|uniref:Carbon-nitrogen family hydrolase n=1 Tax=Anaerobacillus isosaccharinicus TaxID=1532552 RepID=A0A1S2LEU2_9BACI|nr:carbon-nitrogen family hydrolase [Anaerobacillus isosaccharinicus]MBA5586277.1 carbon-nitrogen family hydrolase [Anaerobacillus isosaccharinicus]QOY35471.1 carbon-nitrogen family hydrolase [Anaerobacillus isosaccharinicus]
MKVTCLQFDIVFGNPSANKQRVQEEITKAMVGAPDVIVLPELWTTGYDLTRLDDIADTNGAESQLFLSNLAKEHHVNIVGGSIAKKTDAGITNTTYFFNRSGDCIGEYSKVHLFKLMDEHLYLKAGNTKGHFKLDGISSSGVICYDIRFPEWLRAHTTDGAEIVFVVAQWPLARLEHWRTLLISRAIENQCYIVACNRSGSDPNNEFAGHSMIIDPWGEVVAEASKHPEHLTATLDLEKVPQVRKQIPIFADRRTDLY